MSIKPYNTMKLCSDSMFDLKRTIESKLGLESCEDFMCMIGESLDFLSTAIKCQNNRYFRHMKKQSFYDMKIGFWYIMNTMTNPDDSRTTAEQIFPWKSEIISAYKINKATVIRYRYTLSPEHVFELSVKLDDIYIKYHNVLDLKNFQFIEQPDTFTDDTALESTVDIEDKWFELLDKCEKHNWGIFSILDPRWVHRMLADIYKQTDTIRIVHASANPVYKMFRIQKLYIFRYDKETDTVHYTEATDSHIGTDLGTGEQTLMTSDTKFFNKKYGICLYNIWESEDKTKLLYSNLSKEMADAIRHFKWCADKPYYVEKL